MQEGSELLESRCGVLEVSLLCWGWRAMLVRGAPDSQDSV